MNSQHYLSWMLLFLIAGCVRTTVHPGIETTVTGIVQDPKKQKPIAGQRVEISESRKRGLFGPPGYFKIIDSTITGPDGRFKIKFKTTGRGTEYHVRLDLPIDFHIYQNSASIINIGDSNMINFSVYELHTLKATLQIVNNPKPPLRASSTYGGRADVYGVNKDTIVYFKVLPDQVNYLHFNITNPDSAQYYNIRRDTILFSGFADTFSRTFQLDPRTFPRR